jgi:anhydro-N-acetylmuramic acid kinase
MVKRLLLGLSAGPSADGIRAALIEVQGRGWEVRVQVLATHTEGFDAELRQLLLQVSTPETCELRQLALVHRVLGEAFALTARRLADRASVSLPQVLCAGCLGFEAWHKTEGPYPSSLSLGAGAVMAERLGITVMQDFRWRDLACQGIGAPLSAVPSYLLFHAPAETRLVLHLGGLTHAVLLPAGAALKDVQAWEVGPGNALLNALVEQLTQGRERYDAGGHHAVQGRQIPDLLYNWQRHPFLLRTAPRSIPRTQFAEQMAKQGITLAEQHQWEARDLLCTAHHLIALAVRDSLKLWGKQASLDKVILTGGGAKNGFLWRLLEEQLAGVEMLRSDALNIPSEATTAVYAALLACFLLDSTPGNLPQVTGATGARVLGSITPGGASNWTACLDWLSGRETAYPPWEED